MSNDDLTPHESEELKRAVLDLEPPHHIRRSVLDALRSQGLVVDEAPQRRRWSAVAAVAALALAAFVAGMAAGTFRMQQPARGASGNDTYMLLLRESETSAPVDSTETARLVSEYREWARARAEDDILVGGEKLDAGGIVLTPDVAGPAAWAPEEGFIGGFFLVRASSYEDAATIAGTCPHLRHGGTIEIRRVDS